LGSPTIGLEVAIEGCVLRARVDAEADLIAEHAAQEYERAAATRIRSRVAVAEDGGGVSALYMEGRDRLMWPAVNPAA
jgi:hypothetical protein